MIWDLGGTAMSRRTGGSAKARLRDWRQSARVERRGGFRSPRLTTPRFRKPRGSSALQEVLWFDPRRLPPVRIAWGQTTAPIRERHGKGRRPTSGAFYQAERRKSQVARDRYPMEIVLNQGPAYDAPGTFDVVATGLGDPGKPRPGSALSEELLDGVAQGWPDAIDIGWIAVPGLENFGGLGLILLKPVLLVGLEQELEHGQLPVAFEFHSESIHDDPGRVGQQFDGGRLGGIALKGVAVGADDIGKARWDLGNVRKANAQRDEGNVGQLDARFRRRNFTDDVTRAIAELVLPR